MWYLRDILDILIGYCLFLNSCTRVSRWFFLFRMEWTDWGNHLLPLCVGIPHWFILLLIFRYPNPSLVWRYVTNWWITCCFLEYVWWCVRLFDWISMVNSKCGIVPWKTPLLKTIPLWLTWPNFLADQHRYLLITPHDMKAFGGARYRQWPQDF